MYIGRIGHQRYLAPEKTKNKLNRKEEAVISFDLFQRTYENIKYLGYLPGELTWRFPALLTCRVHRPSAFSPQKCTLRKGQSSKLELRTSRGLSNSNVDVVPIGDVSNSLKFPRGKNLKDTLIGRMIILFRWKKSLSIILTLFNFCFRFLKNIWYCNSIWIFSRDKPLKFVQNSVLHIYVYIHIKIVLLCDVMHVRRWYVYTE